MDGILSLINTSRITLCQQPVH